jgi:hypothetical protein
VRRDTVPIALRRVFVGPIEYKPPINERGLSPNTLGTRKWHVEDFQAHTDLTASRCSFSAKFAGASLPPL